MPLSSHDTPAPAEALQWPPPEADIEAIEVIDLRPGGLSVRHNAVASLTRPGETALAGRQQSREISPGIWCPPPPPPSRRRLRAWMCLLPLAAVEIAAFLSNEPSYLAQLPAQAAAPPTTAGSALPTPRALAAPIEEDHGRPAASARSERRHVAPDRPLRPATRVRRTTESHADAGSARVTLRPTEPREVVEADPSPPPVESASAAVFEPPRSIDQHRPQRVPSPFPSPRGSRTSLELVIDERGHVASARVASSGAGYYDAPLLAAARTWRFEPARADGRPTRTVHTVEVTVP